MRELFIDDPDIFDTLYTGFLVPSDGGSVKGLEKINLTVAVLDALDAISEETTVNIAMLREVLSNETLDERQRAGLLEQAAAMMRSGRRLRSGGGTLLLENEEFDALYGKLQGVSWMPIAARRAQKTLRLLSDAPKVTARSQGVPR